jgi:hypothetical protein
MAVAVSRNGASVVQLAPRCIGWRAAANAFIAASTSGTHGAAYNAEMFVPVLEFVEVGVITRPTSRAADPPAPGERPDDIAVRVEQTDLRYSRARQVFLPPRLAQQIFRLEDRGRGKVLAG